MRELPGAVDTPVPGAPGPCRGNLVTVTAAAAQHCPGSDDRASATRSDGNMTRWAPSQRGLTSGPPRAMHCRGGPGAGSGRTVTRRHRPGPGNSAG